MSIVKMKFVSVSTDKSHLDEMLIRALDSNLLNPELATSIINEDTGGKVINSENVYDEYLNSLKNMSHSIGMDITGKEKSDRTYTNEEIEKVIKEFSDKVELSSCGDDVLLTADDQKALDALSECDFEKIHSCSYINFGLGRLPIESYKKLNLLDHLDFDTCVLHSNAQYHWIVYAASNTYFADARRLLNSLFFEEIRIPNIDVHRVIEEYCDILKDIYAYCELNDSLHRLYDYVVIYDDNYVLSGFTPESEVENFKKVFDGMDVKFEVKNPDEVPDVKAPTLLKNNWFFKPFEMFVDMYSLPDYNDFDPTLFLGITYCILFGIMFGDLGQGLVLFLGGTYLYDIKKSKNKLTGIVSRIGLTSMVFGFLFGSVFGNEEVLTPIHQMLFRTEHKLIEVMDPNMTMTLLLGAVAIGMVLILSSIVMNIYKNYKHKLYGEMLFSQNGVAGLVLYMYVVFVALNMFILGGNVLTPVFIVPFVVVPFLCFFFKEPLTAALNHEPVTPHEGWGGFVLQTIFEMITIVLEYVSNTMSFMRVGGFILSHAGMMLVVSILMEMSGNAGIVVFILGNIFVMCLEGLIVGIQTLRLEYYEMFSRFYEGGGKKFKILTSVK